MRRAIAALALLALSLTAFAGSTRYLSDVRFDNLDNLEFDNVSFVDGGGIELARATSPVFKSDEPVWSAETAFDGLLISAGNTAKLLLLKKDTNLTVYEDEKQLLFSDMRVSGGKLYLSSIPKGKITVLDKNFKQTAEYSFSNQYIWALVPNRDAMYILAGSPAELSMLDRQGKITVLARLSNENNLLKGILKGDDLYFAGDGNTLYRWSAGKLSVVASFDNSIADFCFDGDRIYAVTSISEQKKPQAPSSSMPNTATDGDVGKPMTPPTGRKQGARSSLWRVEKDGRAEELFWKSNVRFLSVAQLGGNFVIGSDKNGGYFEVGFDGSAARFTSLGEGKFARFAEVAGETWAVMLEPSRILRIGKDYAKSGTFLSTTFDCSTLSDWGRPIFGKTTPAGTSARLYTRSSLVSEESLFDNWRVAESNVASPAGRYLNYKVELTGDGNSTPSFRGLSIPYVQKNLSPRIERVTLQQTAAGIKAQWDASDDNRDAMVYDAFVAPLDGEWQKVNDKPLEENSIELLRDNLPEGRYRLKVTASDASANNATEARTSLRVSDPFLLDNTPPVISSISATNTADGFELRFSAKDAWSPIAEAWYSVNGGRFIRALPADGIFDNPEEEFRLRVSAPKNALLQVKVVDLFGNYETKGLVLR